VRSSGVWSEREGRASCGACRGKPKRRATRRTIQARDGPTDSRTTIEAVPVIAAIVGGVVGLAAALAAEPLVARLPATVEDALEQPAWTRRFRRPPAMEATGVVFGVLAGLRLGWTAPLVPGLLLAALLVPIIFIDIEHRVIPNRIVLPGTVAALAIWAVIDLGALPEHVGAAVAAFLIFLLMALAYPAGMGLGDVKLALMLGAFLGWQVFAAIVASFVISLVPSLLILLLRGWSAGRKTALPFGPFLALGGMVGLLWGQALIDLYAGRR
jgi:leader peptidase (prepilin peptidase)/N-methyltransferase